MRKEYREFLLEINVEELPVGYVRPALRQLCDAFLKEFDALKIDYDKKDGLKLGGTGVRLILYIKNLSASQEEFSSEVWGPPKNIAFDEKGNPTKQALGFAKSQGFKVEDIIFKTKAKGGEYAVLEKKEKPRKTKEILQEITPRIIKAIHFPKTMRWDNSGLYFARPIESILLLFGKEKVNIKIGRVPQKKVGFGSPSEYLKEIQRRCLIYPDERKEEIERLVLEAAGKIKGDEYVDKNLLEEVTFMVSCPRKFIGEFNKKFLALPEDVLKASMSKYQRVFPVLKKGRITNRFIAIIDGDKKDTKLIRENYENILEARLKDSLFFFEDDSKSPLSEKTLQLKDLIFQARLGNMFEKTERLESLCSFICEKLNIQNTVKRNIQKAAQLSKADLVTHMVGEFPSLQGVMGREYALKMGEEKEVAQAIREHYMPQGMDGELPQSLEGAILAISDRIDNVVGFLGIKIDLSGSFDPFGIRRNAQGFIQIIQNKSLRLKIDEIIEKAVELYQDRLCIPQDELKNKIIDYIKERIEFLIGDVRPVELKKAILGVGCYDIVGVFKRFDELSSISSKRYFLEAAKVVERTGNILKGAKSERIKDVDEGLFKDDLEREVWKAYLNVAEKIQDLAGQERYKDATLEYANAFFKVLHEFFDKVLVNAEDNSLRSNRLAVMKAINKLYTANIADLAVLPQIVVK